MNSSITKEALPTFPRLQIRIFLEGRDSSQWIEKRVFEKGSLELCPNKDPSRHGAVLAVIDFRIPGTSTFSWAVLCVILGLKSSCANFQVFLMRRLLQFCEDADAGWWQGAVWAIAITMSELLRVLLFGVTWGVAYR